MGDILSIDREHFCTNDISAPPREPGPAADHSKIAAALRKLGSINVFVGICVLLYFLGAGLAVTLSARLAHAQDAGTNGPDLVTMDKIGRAGLVFLTSVEGAYVFAPEISTDVTIDVTGITARTIVRQTFLNPTDGWLEGVYVMPLPDDSAIDHLRIVIGDRVIEAEIQERAQARRTYEQARDAGQRAALMEQGRPNQFTMSVANIGPLSEITVETEYQTLVHIDDGLFELRFPMAVAPRYLPKTPSVYSVAFGSGPETAGPNGSVVFQPGDGDTLPGGPVLIDPDPERIHLPVAIRVNLEAGFAASGLASAFHAVDVVELGPDRFTISLADQVVPANRDFVLEWQAPLTGGPTSHIFTETVDGTDGPRGFVLGLVVPPLSADEGVEAPPRDMLFILDVSGSMHGASIAQAKSALVTALARLRAVDRFNVIAFANESRAVFPDLVAAEPNNLAIVAGFVGGLQADGGTEMGPAIELALTMINDRDEGAHFRQIVLLTDGAVGNEDQLFQMISSRIGDTRLFTIGIGSAPNSWFMRKSAEVGRGSFTHIGDIAQVEERVTGLLAQISAPVLTDIEVTMSSGWALAMTPARIPDLYRGQPVVFSGELTSLGRGSTAPTVTIAGRANGEPWSVELALGDPAASDDVGVASMWARRRIEAELDSLFEGADETKVRQTVLDLALEYHLVSPYTSLVAVEEEIVRPADQDVTQADVPRHLPDGWSARHVFGLMDDGSFGTQRAEAEPAMLMMAQAAPPPMGEMTATGATVRIGGRVSALPQTATPAGLLTVFGSLLLGLALFLLVWGGPRRRVGRAS